MTIEQRVAVLEEIFSKLQDYYMSDYSGEEIDALLASAGVPIGITKEYDSVSAMNDDFSSTDVTRGQFVLILTTDTASEDYGKVYLKGSANWVYVFTLTSLTAIKGPQGPAGKRGAKGADGADGKNFMVLGYYETLSALNAAVPSPGTGDTYGVGTEPPYAFYMYDPTISNWRYVGNLQGPAGPTGGEDNFVRYDAAQSLTDAQKQQARTNIGADTVQGAVRYDAAQTLTDAQKTQARNNISAMQGIESADHPSCNYVLNGSTVEWINPPMNDDEYTVYRMLDRYKAQPIYRGTLGDFEVWQPDSTVWPHGGGWGSAGKAIMYTVKAGQTKNITLPHDRTFLISWADNLRYGLVVVQTLAGSVRAITTVVPLGNWKIEIGTGLSVNVTELDGKWSGDLSVFMI